MADSNLAGHLAADDPHPQYTQKGLLPSQGDLIVGLGDGAVGVHSVDQPGFILFSIPNSPYGTGLMWLPFDAVRASLLRHKGDLVTTDGRGNIIIIPVGTPGQILVSDPTVPGGLVWLTVTDTIYRPVFDASSAAIGNLPSFTHTCGVGTDISGYLVVVVADWNVNPLSGYATSCTYNGITMFPLASHIITPAGFRLFGLLDPPPGAHTVAVHLGTGAAPIAAAMSFTNVNQFSPVLPRVKNAGNSTLASVSLPAPVKSLIISFVSYFGGNTGVVAGLGQEHEILLTSGNSGISMSVKPSDTVGLVSESWGSVGFDSWAIGALALLPVE